MIRITELARKTGASVDELHYLEKKGFVSSEPLELKQRKVRQYRDTDIRKLQYTIKYRRQGFTWDAAYHKALQEMENPRLFDIKQAESVE